MRVAFIHDWLVGMRGGEKCLEVLTKLYPNSDVYTVFHDNKNISKQLESKNIFSSFLNKLPLVKKYYRFLLPFYPLAAKNLSAKLADNHTNKPYDLVISISHCVAKNVKAPESVPHLCYCLTPVRYLWDQYDAYFKNKPYEPIVRLFSSFLRRWDVSGSSSVDHFSCISNFIGKKIEKYYQRNSSVVYPPVDASWIQEVQKDSLRENFFLCVSALVPYKNVDVIVEAFNKLELPLVVVGSGPEKKNLLSVAKNNISFKEGLSEKELATLYCQARALVFAAEEDFGMVPVEAQAAGLPVICYEKGGCLETVVANLDIQNNTGLMFNELTSEAIVNAVKKFMEIENNFSLENLINKAEEFSLNEFENKFTEFVSLSLSDEKVSIDISEETSKLRAA